METLINRNPKTLAADIVGSGTTTMTLSDVTGLPSTGNVRALIEDELILVILNGTTSVTIVRAIESTTAVPHSNGTNVNFILTAGSLRQYSLDIIQTGPYGSRPSAASNCQRYIDTDSPTIGLNNGASFVTYWRDRPINPPVMTNFTPIAYAVPTGSYYVRNQSKGAGQLVFYANNNGGVHNVGGYVMPVNTNNTVDWTATLGFETNVQTSGNYQFGIGAFCSANGNFTIYGPQTAGNVYEQIAQYNTNGFGNSSSSSFGANILGNVQNNFCDYKYLQLRYRHTLANNALQIYQSTDGLSYNYVATVAYSTMNVPTIDYVGFGLRSYTCFNYTPSDPSGMTVYHWLYEEG